MPIVNGGGKQEVVNTTVINSTTINTTTINGVQIKDDVDIYVSPSGSDETGDGTSGKPFASIIVGLQEAANYLSPSTKNIHLEPGVYQEDIDIPSNILGPIKISGVTKNPDDVILKATSSSKNCISSGSSDDISLLTLDHLTIRDSNRAVDLSGRRLSIGHVKFINNYYAVYAVENSYITVLNGGENHMMSIVGLGDSTTSYGMFAGRNSSIVINNGISISGVRIGLFVNDRSYLGISTIIPLEITLTGTTTGYAGILIRYSSYGYVNGPVIIDGINPAKSDLGIQVVDSILMFVGLPATQITFKNLYYGFNSEGISEIGAGNSSPTFTYINVTKPAYISYSSIIASQDSLDTTIEWYKDFQGSFQSLYGYDQRYLQSETDPVFTSSAVSGVTTEDIQSWTTTASRVDQDLKTTSSPKFSGVEITGESICLGTSVSGGSTQVIVFTNVSVSGLAVLHEIKLNPGETVLIRVDVNHTYFDTQFIYAAYGFSGVFVKNDNYPIAQSGSTMVHYSNVELTSTVYSGEVNFRVDTENNKVQIIKYSGGGPLRGESRCKATITYNKVTL